MEDVSSLAVQPNSTLLFLWENFLSLVCTLDGRTAPQPVTPTWPQGPPLLSSGSYPAIVLGMKVTTRGDGSGRWRSQVVWLPAQLC